MSRSFKNSKGAGYEYWGRRFGTGLSPSNENKRMINRHERRKITEVLRTDDKIRGLRADDIIVDDIQIL